MFWAILATLVEIQQQGGIKDIAVTLGNTTKRVNILLPVTFIIGDIQGGDKICCRAPTYVNTVNRLCRKCDCRGNQSSDPLVGCLKISQVKVLQALDNNEVETLHEFNQYNVRSAFFDLCYGGCKYGIFSAACPIEPLHALENGIMNDAIKILLEEYLQPNDHKWLDEIVRKLTTLECQKFLSSGSDKEMLHLLWQSGVMTPTDLTAWKSWYSDDNYSRVLNWGRIQLFQSSTKGRRDKIYGWDLPNAVDLLDVAQEDTLLAM